MGTTTRVARSHQARTLHCRHQVFDSHLACRKSAMVETLDMCSPYSRRLGQQGGTYKSWH